MNDLIEEIPEAERFRAIANYTYDWESWVAPDGRTLWINPAVERITGYSVQECLALPDYPLPLIHADDRAFFSDILQRAGAGGAGNDVEFRLFHKDGSLRWLAISWQSIFSMNGESLGFRTSVRDINARKVVEERLAWAKHKAEQANAAKDAFLANMSHEMRSPLQCISGYAELLKLSALDPGQRRHLGIIVEQNEALLRLVGEILDFSSLEAGALRFEAAPFSLRELVGQVIDTFATAARGKGLELLAEVAPEVPELLLGDRGRVRQVLTNLLGNAVKFTAEGGAAIRVDRLEGDAERCRLALRITDSGPGFSAEVTSKLFEPFWQADLSHARRYGGSGLGLAICRRLTELMQGTIRGESRPEGGAVFTVELPFTLAHAPAREMAPAPPPSEEPPSPSFAARFPLAILVVEDSAAARELVVEFLRLLGYAPGAAESAEAARTMARAQAYDLIFMDVQMPGADGFEATRWIREDEAAAGRSASRVVALTANVFAEHRSRSVDSGMDGFVTKPVRLGELRLLLEQLHQERPRAEALALPVLDGAIVAELAGERARSGETLFERLRLRLDAELPEQIAALLRAVEDEGGEVAARLAHQIKGNCSLIGARRLSAAAARVEEAAEAGAWPRARDSAQALWPGLEALRAAWAAR